MVCPSHINTGFCRRRFELRRVEAIDCRLDAGPIATSLVSTVGVSCLLTLAWASGGIANSETMLQMTRVSLASIKRPRPVTPNPRRFVGPLSAMRARRLENASRGQAVRYLYTSSGSLFA